MKVKVIPAFLPDSSVTVRLTSTEIARLLYKCDHAQFESVMVEFITEVGTFSGKERLDEVTKTLLELIDTEVNEDE